MEINNENVKTMLNDSRSLISVFDKKTGSFSYDNDMSDYFGEDLSSSLLWDYLLNAKIITKAERDEIEEIVLSLNEDKRAFFKIYSFRGTCPHAISFIYSSNKVTVHINNIGDGTSCGEFVKLDDLTGLLTQKDFCNKIVEINNDNPNTSYSLCFFDIIKFKAINDIFGFAEGDALLVYIADKLKNDNTSIVAACRITADRFAFLADVTNESSQDIVEGLIHKIKQYELPFEISINVGVYAISKSDEIGNSMLDKAMLAQAAIKGSYTNPINFYMDKLRDEMLSEQEITGEMNIALAEEQFLVYFQPQYNHSTGMLVGAEALVRWYHPQKGMISPGRFIPTFEKNGFITKLDFYVFEKAAKFIKYSMDNNFAVVPISVNFSKHDIFLPDFVETLENIREKYQVPAKYLRVEITESVLMGNNKTVNDILKKLHYCGYIVEMDDFGSGYSSLNVLKDLDFDMIKLDMLFLKNEGANNRGGTILTSVVNMARWLNIPVIAEGVETVEQADFLKSIGCDYIQGYLYARPMPEKEYEALISQSNVGAIIPQLDLVETLDSANFWEPTSQETLIFSNFVGAAVIFNYDRITKRVEILRVNQKYLRELGMNLSEKDIIHGNPVDSLDDKNKEVYINTLERAIETGKEQECETWREIKSECCGSEYFCIRSTVTVIGKSDNYILFYGMIRNITAEKNSFNALLDTEKRFKMASEQVNIYFWEYTVSTREMRPCFRCMRDLGLPAILRNYPDSAIEAGVFPPEVADMYRDWHVQIANGVKELEAVIPLTMDRVPFRVKYTTEFDENGFPVKAYGSAALVVE